MNITEEKEHRIKKGGLKNNEIVHLRFGVEITESEEIFYQALLKEFDGIIDIHQITIEQGYLHLWFCHGINTLGGIKLRGRVLKIYNPKSPAQIIADLDEAIGYLPLWSSWVKQQKIEGIYNEYYE